MKYFHQPPQTGTVRFRRNAKFRLLASAISLVLLGSNACAQSPAQSEAEDRCRDAAGFNAAGFWIREPSADAVLLCERASEGGNADVLAFLGRALYFQMPPAAQRALDAIQTSQAAGSSVGIALMGIVHYHGYAVKQDDALAAQWFLKAAQLGHMNAQYNLGVLLSAGRGMPRDIDGAMAWYRKAAGQGDRNAQFTLGYAYEKGQVVATDMKAAALWYGRAAAQGDREAQERLASINKADRRLTD